MLLFRFSVRNKTKVLYFKENVMQIIFSKGTPHFWKGYTVQKPNRKSVRPVCLKASSPDIALPITPKKLSHKTLQCDGCQVNNDSSLFFCIGDLKMMKNHGIVPI